MAWTPAWAATSVPRHRSKERFIESGRIVPRRPVACIRDRDELRARNAAMRGFRKDPGVRPSQLPLRYRHRDLDLPKLRAGDANGRRRLPLQEQGARVVDEHRL